MLQMLQQARNLSQTSTLVNIKNKKNYSTSYQKKNLQIALKEQYGGDWFTNVTWLKMADKRILEYLINCNFEVMTMSVKTIAGRTKTSVSSVTRALSNLDKNNAIKRERCFGYCKKTLVYETIYEFMTRSETVKVAVRNSHSDGLSKEITIYNRSTSDQTNVIDATLGYPTIKDVRSKVDRFNVRDFEGKESTNNTISSHNPVNYPINPTEQFPRGYRAKIAKLKAIQNAKNAPKWLVERRERINAALLSDAGRKAGFNADHAAQIIDLHPERYKTETAVETIEKFIYDFHEYELQIKNAPAYLISIMRNYQTYMSVERRAEKRDQRIEREKRKEQKIEQARTPQPSIMDQALEEIRQFKINPLTNNPIIFESVAPPAESEGRKYLGSMLEMLKAERAREQAEAEARANRKGLFDLD